MAHLPDIYIPFTRACLLVALLISTTLRPATAQTDSLVPEPYLAYTLFGETEISVFELDSRVRLRHTGHASYVVGYITDLNEEYLFLDGRPIAYESIITLHRYSERIEKQRKGATWGSIGATAGFFLGAILVNNSYEFVPSALGTLMAYYGAALAPALQAAKPLITRKYRTTQDFQFRMGPLPGTANPPDNAGSPTPPDIVGRPYTYRQKPTVPRSALGIWANGDGTLGLNYEYLATPKFALGVVANPFFSHTLQVGMKIYTRPYIENQWNWHINLKAGNWNSLFRPLEIGGIYLGSGFQQYQGKRLYWGVQGGAWLDTYSEVLVPEVSAQVGVRLGRIPQYFKN